MIDHALFEPATIDPETKRLNAEIVAAHGAQADPWSLPIAEVRARRRAGTPASPAMPRSRRAETLTIDGPGGPLALRVVRPKPGIRLRGAYLHIHRGGWVWGSADEQDPWLERIADACGFVCLSVEYRLAPEHPYPAALLDCEAAALWLAGPGKAEFGVSALTIGGESVGAHLAVMVLLRLRDRHGLPRAFQGANLNAGFFDLGLTPSVRNWGEARLVVNTRDLKGLPPALFTVGTCDPLLDDTLYMSGRWAAAANGGHTAVYPGGCHIFVRYPGAMTERALELIDRFLMALA